MLNSKFDRPHFMKVFVLFSTVIKLKLGHDFSQFICTFKIGINECWSYTVLPNFPNQTFYYFRRVNFGISEDLVIMGVINWFILLAVSEYLNILPMINAILPDP